MVLVGDYDVDAQPVYSSDTTVVVKAVDRLLCKRVFDKGVRKKKTGMVAKEFFAAMELLVLASAELPPFLHDPKGSQRRVWSDQFDDLAQDGDAISFDVFSKYCEETLGPLTVAIKFMTDKNAYDKEVQLRRVANIAVLPELPSDVSSIRATAAFLGGDALVDLSLFPHAIAMPFATLTLADLLSTETMEQKFHRLKELAEALSAFHKEHMMHGDVTAFDVVFVHGKLYVIDGDASAVIGRDQLAVKFSTSVLPPEMFYELNQDEVDAVKAYWDHRGAAHQARVVERSGSFTVKACCPTKGADGLPYPPVRASQKADSWAFGCLMFKVLTNEDLVPVVDRGDVHPEHLQRAASWTADSIRDRVTSAVSEPHAAALLLGLLDPDPSNRFPVQKVPTDPFFTGAVAPRELESRMKKTVKDAEALKRKADEVLEQARRNNRQLLATMAEIEAAVDTMKRTIFTAVLEAGDVVVPSSYIVLPAKLGLTAEDIAAARATTDNLLAFLVSMGSEFVSALSSTTATANVLREMAGGRPMYLYLVDEVTRLPVLPDDDDPVYPIKLVADSTQYIEFMTTCMPTIQSSFRLLQQGNNVARLLGWFGVPSVDRDVLDLTQAVINAMACTPRVFAAQLSAPPGMGSEEAVMAVRGAELRMLQGFLEAQDPNQTFCGLARAPDLANGKAIWTTEARVNQLKSGVPLADVQRMALAEEAAKAAEEQAALQQMLADEAAVATPQQDAPVAVVAVAAPLQYPTVAEAAVPPHQDTNVAEAAVVEGAIAVPLHGGAVAEEAPARRHEKEENCNAFLGRVGGDVQKSCVNMCLIM